MCPRAVLVLCLLLPFSSRATPPEGESRLPVLEAVRVREEFSPVHGRGLVLSFERHPSDPVLARLSVEDARVFIEVLEGAFPLARSSSGPPAAKRFLVGAAMTGTFLGSPSDRRFADLERRLRAGFEELLGPSSLPLPSSLEDSRWFLALKLSPRYMGDGVREAAMELLSSPAVAYSLALSMMLYMTAWVAPEPLFSKAFAAAVTVGLLMTYTAAELYTVGMACLTLYREAEAARTPEQLEAAAAHFGKAIGGVGLRVLVTVAGAKLAKGLPEVPRGGLWARFSPPRFGFPGGGARGGIIVGAGTRAQVSVANGTVVLMGLSANTVASALAAAVAPARTSGDCRPESDKSDAKGHHIATDKNEISNASGGPWTPLFKDLFNRAGMSLDDPANIVYLIGHVGPHPEAYHQKVYIRLQTALGECDVHAECRAKLVEELDKIAADICKPGAVLNNLLKRKP